MRFKIAPKIIECADGEMEWKQEEDTPPTSPEPSPEPIPEKELKKQRRKKKLSEAQLAALEKGRIRVAENKRNKELKKKRDEFIERQSKQKEKEFVEQGIKQTKSAKLKKEYLKKSTKESKIREKLLEKKRREEWEIERHTRWESLREEALDNCETIEDFEELTEHLDSVGEEEIFDDEKLKSKLNNIYDTYKYVPKEPEGFEATKQAIEE